MNTYCIKPQFAPALGPLFAKFAAFCRKMQCNLVQNAVQFGAKRSAIWCKTQCNLVQNAVRFDAKHKVKWCKTRGNTYKYPPLWYKKDLYKPLKTWLKRAKQLLKSGVLGAKSGELDFKNYDTATKLERLKGTKCRFCSQKRTNQRA